MKKEEYIEKNGLSNNHQNQAEYHFEYDHDILTVLKQDGEITTVL